MTNISKLYPYIKKTGLSESKANELVEVIDESLAINLVTKKDF